MVNGVLWLCGYGFLLKLSLMAAERWLAAVASGGDGVGVKGRGREVFGGGPW